MDIEAFIVGCERLVGEVTEEARGVVVLKVPAFWERMRVRRGEQEHAVVNILWPSDESEGRVLLGGGVFRMRVSDSSELGRLYKQHRAQVAGLVLPGQDGPGAGPPA